MDIPNSWCFIIVDHVPIICFLLKLPYKFKAKPEFNPEREKSPQLRLPPGLLAWAATRRTSEELGRYGLTWKNMETHNTIWIIIMIIYI